MADLTQSGVTINYAWQEGGAGMKDLSCRQVTLVLSAAGGTTSGNQIPVALFSLSKLIDATLFVDSATTVCAQGVPNFAGTLLCFPDAANAAAGNHATVFTAAGLTGTFRGIVKGYL